MNERSLFDDPPSQPHSRTSQKAAQEIKLSAETLRKAVYDYLVGRGDLGATDEQIQDDTGIPPSTQRPRRIELVRGGFVRDSNRTRETKSGRQATVWVAVTKPSGGA